MLPLGPKKPNFLRVSPDVPASPRISPPLQKLLSSYIGDLLGPGSQLLHAQEREWASATFEGARHRFEFDVAAGGDAGANILRMADQLPEYQFRLRGEIVADCTATLGGLVQTADATLRRLLIIELLTINAD